MLRVYTRVLLDVYARGARRRSIGGFEGWGRHLSCGPAAAATPTFALTHPSNLRETMRLSDRTITMSSQSPVCLTRAAR